VNKNIVNTLLRVRHHDLVNSYKWDIRVTNYHGYFPFVLITIPTFLHS